MKRLLSVLLALLVAFSAVNAACFSAFAQEEKEMSSEFMDQKPYEAAVEIAPLASVMETAEFRAYVLSELKKCNTSINISSYKIPYNDANSAAIYSYIFNEMIEAFHVNGVGYSYTSSYITKINLRYTCTAEEFQELFAKTDKIADEMVSDIKSADLSQAEKALIIHDRLALHCAYDYNFKTNDTEMEESLGIYGAFVESQVICQGYSRAYKYLLKKVGIDSYLCTSDDLNHMWNIVYIDGKKYHTDVTWDDSTPTNSYNAPGKVMHDNFLLSTTALYNGVTEDSAHNATDYDSSPSDTTYDSFRWQNSTTAFQYVNGNLYYIDNISAKLMNFTTNTSLCSVSDTWQGGESSFWRGNFAKLSSDGENLFYSTSDTIYKYDLDENNSTAIYNPDLSVGDYYSIFGMQYKNDGYIHYSLTNDANFSDLSNIKEGKFLFDDVKPTAQVAVTTNIAIMQTVRFTLNDNTGISGYYWGTSRTYTDNRFVETQNTTVYTNVTEPGIYYLVVKDLAGNISDTYFITFVKTTLDANGGTVTPEYIISTVGHEIMLPTPSFGSYEFKGWATSLTASNGDTSIIPQNDSTLYAIWKNIPVVLSEISVNTLPDKTVYFLGEDFDSTGLTLTLTYSNGTTETISEGFTVSGFDSSTTGTKELTVSYYDLETKFNVSVEAVQITDVTIAEYPVKTEYFVGDTFSTNGLKLLVSYSDNTTKIAGYDYLFVTPDMSTPGKKTVDIHYNGFTVCFDINVKAVELTSVSVFSNPDKTEYFVGDTIDTTGLKLLLTYNNGVTEIADKGYTLSKTVLDKSGNQAIIVYINHMSVAFNVTVTEVVAESVSVSSTPVKTNYFTGDILDTTGLKLTVVYNNGTIEIIDKGFTVDTTLLETSGQQRIPVNYEGFTVHFIINVTALAITDVKVHTGPDVTDYFVGDTFNPTGITLELLYNNSTTKIIDSGFNLSIPDMSTAGVKTIYVYYKNFALYVQITVNKIEPDFITLVSLPDKTQYFCGNALDLTGLEIILAYTNGSAEDVTDKCVISGYEPLKAGTQTITATYENLAVSFEVTVKEPTLINVEIIKEPDKTTYYVGEELDTTGMQLKLTYDSGDTVILTEGFESKGVVMKAAGKQEISITVATIKISFFVTVLEKDDPTESTAEITTTAEASTVAGTTVAGTTVTGTTVTGTTVTGTTVTGTTVAGTTVADTTPTETSTFYTDPDETETTEVTETTASDGTESTPASTTTTSEATTTDTADEMLLGDVNFDKKVNIKDATAIQKHLAKLVILEEKALVVADFDKNQKLNIKDATNIQKFIAGLLR